MTGGRQSDKKFDEHPNSIGAKLNTGDFDPELRRKFFENKRKFTEDQQAMEAWASDGFGSGLNTVQDDD